LKEGSFSGQVAAFESSFVQKRFCKGNFFPKARLLLLMLFPQELAPADEVPSKPSFFFLFPSTLANEKGIPPGEAFSEFRD